MVTGSRREPITEAQYRQIELDSYSSLKVFSEDRKKYFRKYLMGEQVEEDENQSVKMGQLVDCLLLDRQNYDKKYHLSQAPRIPTGLMLQFVECLYKRTRECAAENGEITREFMAIAQDAYNDVKFDGTGQVVAFKKDSFQKVIGERFPEEGEAYYDEIRKVRPTGKTVVTAAEMETAEKIIEDLKSSSTTAHIINQQSDDNYDVYNQVKVEKFTFDGLEMKSMIDKLIVDHDIKAIQPYDLKCVWAVENFFKEYYLYRKAYIQARIYHEAVKVWAAENGLSDYTILSMNFIVCDSLNYYAPLVYRCSTQDISDAYNGFTYKYTDYKGVGEIIKDLLWAKEHNVWRISRQNAEVGGYLRLKP